MITSYLLILCLSAWLMAYLLLRLMDRLARLLKHPLAAAPAGVVALCSTLAFLVVAAAPAPVIVGALLLLGGQFLARQHYLPPVALWGIPLLAAALAASSVTLPAVAGAPPLLRVGVAALGLYTIALGGARLPSSLTLGAAGLLLTLLPLLAAPWLGAPSFLALDVALIGSALLGALMACGGAASLGLARAPFGLLCGWLMLVAVSHGAWVPAAISLLVYAACIAYGLSRTDHDDPHAS